MYQFKNRFRLIATCFVLSLCTLAQAVESNVRLGEMVTVPSGRFLMGNNYEGGAGGPEESPQHWKYLPTYQIGKYEVTRGQYRRFIEAGGYDDPNYWSLEGWKWKESDYMIYAGMHGRFRTVIRPNKEKKRNQPQYWEPEQQWIGHDWGHPVFIQTDQHPVVGVTYYEAEAFCKWAGGRLPTEAEWEKAASWDSEKQHARIWPWGDTWDPELCNNPEDHNPAGGGYRVNQSAPVGSYPEGASPYSCMDIVGNAYEWVADTARSYPGNPEPFEHEGYHFVRGGCWDDSPFSSLRCAYRGWYLPAGSAGVGPGDSDYIGFRIARGPGIETALRDRSDIVFFTGFESEDWNNCWTGFQHSENMRLVDRRSSEHLCEDFCGKALEILVRKGEHYGTSGKFLFKKNLGYEPEELYVRFYTYYAGDFGDQNGSQGYRGKAPGFDGTYGIEGWGGKPNTDGTKGWSCRGSSSGNTQTDGVRFGFYSYEVKTGNYNYGRTLHYDRLIPYDKWVCVEQYLKLNTPGKNDGIARAWIDSKLVFEKTDYRWRNTDKLKIYSYWIDYYRGGKDPANHDHHVYLDNLVISTDKRAGRFYK